MSEEAMRFLALAVLATILGACSPPANKEQGNASAASANEVVSEANEAPGMNAAAASNSSLVALPPYDPKAIPGMARYEDKSFVRRTSVWPNSAIPVCWEVSSAGPERQMVRDAVAQSWEAHSKVRFYGWGQCAANATGIRIAVADIGPHTKGLGTEINNKPQGMVLNFTFKSWSPACASSEAQRVRCIKSIAVHEFGHALAFAHEQNRPDTPGECAQPPQGGNGDTLLTPWDLHSVMNYCNPVYNNNGDLSPLDVQTVRAFYH